MEWASMDPWNRDSNTNRKLFNILIYVHYTTPYTYTCSQYQSTICSSVNHHLRSWIFHGFSRIYQSGETGWNHTLILNGRSFLALNYLDFLISTKMNKACLFKTYWYADHWIRIWSKLNILKQIFYFLKCLKQKSPSHMWVHDECN